MKILLPYQKKLDNSFENDLKRTLQRSNLDGYALLSFSFTDSKGKLYEIDGVLVLYPGLFICLEAKNYVGTWTGSQNEAWKCDGQEIRAIGTNPYVQSRTYAFVLKERLKPLFCPYGLESKIFVNPIIVAPDQAQFNIPRATINQFEYGSRILICNLSSLEKTIAEIGVYDEIKNAFEYIGIESIVRHISGLKSDANLDELVSNFPEPQESKNLPENPLQNPPQSSSQNPDLNLPIKPIKRSDLPKIQNPHPPHADRSKPIIKPKPLVVKTPPAHPLNPKTKTKTIPTRVPKPAKSTVWPSLLKGSLFSIVILSIFLPLLQYVLKTPITQKTIVIGSVSWEKDYQPLQNFLEQKLIPANPLDALFGEDIAVTLQASHRGHASRYPEAIGKIRNHQWDIVFSYSPIIAIEAEDQGYQFIAPMFPDTPGYQSTFFVREDSQIKFDQLSSEYTIALGDFFSASRFYMPIYDLYGSSLHVITNLSPKTIENLVQTGKADLGVGVLNEKLPKDLKILKTSRHIPGAGVYLSPKLSQQDFRQIRRLLLNSPSAIKKEANYDRGLPSDYQNFRKIISRVREVSACSNFEKSPVAFTCGDQSITTIEGELTNIEISGKWQELTITQSSKKSNSICKVVVRDAVLKMAIDYTSVFDLQFRKFRFYVGYPKGKSCSPSQPKLIYQPNQIEIFE